MYEKWKLDLKNSLQEIADLYRATKEEMQVALDSGLDFEGD